MAVPAGGRSEGWSFLGAAALLLGLGGAGCTGADRDSEADLSFHDGPRTVRVERSGAPVEVRGRDLAPIRLHYPNREAPVDAHVDATAIVRLDPDADPGALVALGARPIRPLMPSVGLWLVEAIGEGDGADLASRLSTEIGRATGVVEATPNLYLHMRAMAEPHVPDDPRFGGQWYFDRLDMTTAWGLTLGDPSSSIVVVDTGCDLVHPDLVDKMDPGRDVVDGDDDPTYDPAHRGTAHGTECAGVAAATTDNEEGIAGGCPNCRLRCVRLLSDDALPISANVEAFQFALDVDASVVSNSWGFVDAFPVPQALADAILEVYRNGRGGRGAMVLFAVGNDDREIGDDELQNTEGVLGIGAINNLEEQTPFTNTGHAVDLVTPTGTLTTDISGPDGDDPGDYMELFGGTSSACPVAAGIAGLLVSVAPERTSEELYQVLIDTARPAPLAVPDESGHDLIYGYGIIDPVAALEQVLGIGSGGSGSGGAGGAGATTGTGASGGSRADPEDDSGCSCRTAPSPAVPGWLALAFVLVPWLRRRR